MVSAARYGRVDNSRLEALVQHPGGKATLTWGECRHNRSALHEAVWHGHIDAVRALLCLGANPNLVEKDGSSPLHEAAYCGSYGYEKEKQRKKKRQSTVISQTSLTRYESDMNSFEVDNGGEVSKRLEILQILLDCSSCEVNLMGTYLCTPLWYAACQGWTRGVEVLLNAGASFLRPATSLEEGYHQEHSPLTIALHHGHFETAQLLLDRGAQLTVGEKEAIVAASPIPAKLAAKLDQATCCEDNSSNYSEIFVEGIPCDEIPRHSFAQAISR